MRCRRHPNFFSLQLCFTTAEGGGFQNGCQRRLKVAPEALLPRQAREIPPKACVSRVYIYKYKKRKKYIYFHYTHSCDKLVTQLEIFIGSKICYIVKNCIVKILFYIYIGIATVNSIKHIIAFLACSLIITKKI